MTSVLIGHTGFVGATLARGSSFDLLVNRSNLESLRGAHVRRLVCAGLPAAKWIANEKPHEDAENLRRLEATLCTVRADRVLLISTIDVYPCSRDADETFDCSQKPNHTYGRHRLDFERFIRETFPESFIVRLPALFGAGLKKNILYDLLHGRRLERINPDSRFQWYPLTRLMRDLNAVEARALPLVNFFTEPIQTKKILKEFFPDRRVGESPDALVEYDLQTQYSTHFGAREGYIMTCLEVMREMRIFIELAQQSP